MLTDQVLMGHAVSRRVPALLATHVPHTATCQRSSGPFRGRILAGPARREQDVSSRRYAPKISHESGYTMYCNRKGRLNFDYIGRGRPLPCDMWQSSGRLWLCRVTHAPAAADTLSPGTVATELAGLSYSAQYDRLFQHELDTKRVVPKPSRTAQMQESSAHKVLLSDVFATLKRKLWQRDWAKTDFIYAGFMTFIHGLCLLAPFTFSWPMFSLFVAAYMVTGCLGITLSFHRQISHRSFVTPKWLEYALAYCGVLAVQGDPIEWASSHRYHHLHTDTPLDPHSPYEGFWWSHMGWLLDNEATIVRVGDRSNTNDLEAQPFYRFIQKTYGLHVVAMFAALYLCGGLPAVVWGGALRVAWVYHITWFVNSASHCWGNQTYNTGDLSRNNWWVALLAFGEGWHNNHHAFEFSARHGLEWWQLDPTWWVVSILGHLGLAKTIKLPTTRQKARLALSTAQQ